MVRIHKRMNEFQAQATRSPQERNTRLENMCWRIWNLARQKKQVICFIQFSSLLFDLVRCKICFPICVNRC